MSVITVSGKINKAITTYAANRGIELTYDVGCEALRFWEASNDCEWMCSYFVGADYNLYWSANVYLPEAVKEELPGSITSDAKFKEVIDFLFTSFVKERIEA